MHRIQSEPFDPASILDAFDLHSGASGALVQFFGIVRGDDGLQALELQHYPAMTQVALDALEDEVKTRWPVQNIVIIHRIGRLEVGELIMMVAVSAAHRSDAFLAAEFLMDHLKSRVPFWKKEHRGAESRWVDAKQDDETALKRW